MINAEVFVLLQVKSEDGQMIEKKKKKRAKKQELMMEEDDSEEDCAAMKCLKPTGYTLLLIV